MHEDRERCLGTGMDGYISKPILSQELFDAIERFALPAIETPSEEIDIDRGATVGKSQSLSESGLARGDQSGDLGWGLEGGACSCQRHEGIGNLTHRKGAFEAASTLASTAREEDLGRAEDASRCLQDALMSLKGG